MDQIPIWVAVIGVMGGLITSFSAYRQGIAKARQDLLIEYDKELRAERVAVYKLLFKLMMQLPKYPEPKKLTYEEVEKLACDFTDWYFNQGGGLFLSTTTRESYFDLQDGIKIILKKHAKDAEWIKVEKDDVDTLRTKLGRNNKWKCPDDLKSIVNATIKDVSKSTVPEDFVEYLRRLGSSLRTEMTKDVMTRKLSVLQSTEMQTDFS